MYPILYISIFKLPREYIYRGSNNNINNNNSITYANMLHLAQLSSLSSKREELCQHFFNSITQPNSCLHTLLPPQRDPTIVTRPRGATKYPQITTRTKNTSPSSPTH